jgi:hypothetical protein
MGQNKVEKGTNAKKPVCGVQTGFWGYVRAIIDAV